MAEDNCHCSREIFRDEEAEESGSIFTVASSMPQSSSYPFQGTPLVEEELPILKSISLFNESLQLFNGQGREDVAAVETVISCLPDENQEDEEEDDDDDDSVDAIRRRVVRLRRKLEDEDMAKVVFVPNLANRMFCWHLPFYWDGISKNGVVMCETSQLLLQLKEKKGFMFSVSFLAIGIIRMGFLQGSGPELPSLYPLRRSIPNIPGTKSYYLEVKIQLFLCCQVNNLPLLAMANIGETPLKFEWKNGSCVCSLDGKLDWIVNHPSLVFKEGDTVGLMFQPPTVHLFLNLYEVFSATISPRFAGENFDIYLESQGVLVDLHTDSSDISILKGRPNSKIDSFSSSSESVFLNGTESKHMYGVIAAERWGLQSESLPLQEHLECSSTRVIKEKTFWGTHRMWRVDNFFGRPNSEELMYFHRASAEWLSFGDALAARLNPRREAFSNVFNTLSVDCNKTTPGMWLQAMISSKSYIIGCLCSSSLSGPFSEQISFCESISFEENSGLIGLFEVQLFSEFIHGPLVGFYPVIENRCNVGSVHIPAIHLEVAAFGEETSVVVGEFPPKIYKLPIILHFGDKLGMAIDCTGNPVVLRVLVNNGEIFSLEITLNDLIHDFVPDCGEFCVRKYSLAPQLFFGSVMRVECNLDTFPSRVNLDSTCLKRSPSGTFFGGGQQAKASREQREETVDYPMPPPSSCGGGP